MAKFLLFNGKGGVGKTTCAAAAALKLSKKGKTLIVSTDPAHSLSDSFEKKIGSKETEIAPNLFAVEIDPKENMQKFQDAISGDAPEMPSLPGMDLGGMLSDLDTMPGMDEMTAFDKFLQYIDNDNYDHIVFDTAPTGHTLKFLSLPNVMNSWVGKMIKIKSQLSGAMNMFKNILPFSQDRGENEQQGTDKLEEMKARIEKGKNVLADPKQTQVILVLIPQEMSIAESERAMKQLETYGIKTSKIIINQLQPELKACKFCTTRMKQQVKKVKEISTRFKGMKIVGISLFPEEVKGIEKLKEFGKHL